MGSTLSSNTWNPGSGYSAVQGSLTVTIPKGPQTASRVQMQTLDPLPPGSTEEPGWGPLPRSLL